MSLTLEESRRVLDRLKAEDADRDVRAADSVSAITDSTDVLLQTKSCPAATRRGRPATFTHLSAQQSEPAKHENIEPVVQTGGGLDSNRQSSDQFRFSGEQFLKAKNFHSSEPEVNSARHDTDQSVLSRALSLNDLKSEESRDISSGPVHYYDQKKSLQSQLQSVERRNRILRQLLYSHGAVGQHLVLKPVSSDNSDVASLPEASPTERSVRFDAHPTNVLTSTFLSTPKKMAVDISSIESVSSTDLEQVKCQILNLVNQSKENKPEDTQRDETVKKLMGGIANEGHRQYLNSLIKDIEESSSSVVTTPWLEALQLDLGMKVGESPTVKTAVERNALSAEVEGILRMYAEPTGSGEKLTLCANAMIGFKMAGMVHIFSIRRQHKAKSTACCPLKISCAVVSDALSEAPSTKDDVQHPPSVVATEDLLDGDRSWETPVL